MKLLLTLITLSFATLTFAGDDHKHHHEHDEHKHEKHDHDHKHDHKHDHDHDHDLSAHVHGVVDIKMLFDKKGELEIDITTPSMNLMGFEGKPSNSSEKKARKKALKAAKTYTNLIKFKGMSCKQKDVDVEEEIDGAHSELEIEYKLTCNKKSFKGVSIDAVMLDKYKQTETVNIEWIDEQKQGKLTLDHKKHSQRIR